ncbi:DUF805 domain-containing protein [uncultured Novosphingobium sp.]|uniref:DUF805 domain-containing protein n=1 Tax=uncultured Novosphingobium sp. TaxID=292277 RepID=UPI00259AAA78|nr:DUF805 domain-containing protein [uncultured Novosphingobium sp.]
MIDEEALRSIEKLHQMKQGGIISDADFETAKQDILQGRSRTRAKQASTTAIHPSGPHPDLPGNDDLVGWLKLPLQRYADFTGRSGRKEFWVFQAVVIVLTLIAISGISGGDAWATVMAGLALAGLAVPTIALHVRRFHDQDKSGWFALLNLVPYVGPVIIAVFMMMDGTHGENQYGPDPYNR